MGAEFADDEKVAGYLLSPEFRVLLGLGGVDRAAVPVPRSEATTRPVDEAKPEQQPSTKTAIRSLGKTKSAIVGCSALVARTIATFVANAVFIAKKSSNYDDAPEERYHVPKPYLGRVEETIGDWVLYYESRRDGGRMVYFAAAKVERIEPDVANLGYYYAYVSGYIDFSTLVPFRMDGRVLETSILNDDGSVNPGKGINAVRLISPTEFNTIFRLGLAGAKPDSEKDSQRGSLLEEDQAAYATKRDTTLVTRVIRDATFTQNIRRAYDGTCAFTGLKISDPVGRLEVEAAHIKGVGFAGPDSIRNGIALSRTVHWMFDRGIFSIADDGKILSARKLVPERVKTLLKPDGYVKIPHDPQMAPHRNFLRFHRENIFIG